MKIVSIVGARPQFIKAAPVNRAIEGHNRRGSNPRITEILMHTGQHYDYNMSQIFFDQLKIRKPHYDLGVGSGNHGEMTGMINRRMPEEINRVLTDHISSLLFCPTETAVNNLRKEGIYGEGAINNRLSATSYALPRIVANVGDVMYDAFLFNKELSYNKSKILSKLELRPGSYCLGTVHRQENTEDPQRLLNIFTAFEELSSADCPFIILLHPRTRKALKQNKKKDQFSPHVRLLYPASYLDMIALESQAKVILTDSGGVQKEAYFAEVPCVTLRDETEWIETVEAGWNYLGGADINKIINAFQKAINSLPKRQSKLFGDGKASEILLHELISNSI
jgi:UDP-N-acetylglucosamine 2-epimerase